MKAAALGHGFGAQQRVLVPHGELLAGPLCQPGQGLRAASGSAGTGPGQWPSCCPGRAEHCPVLPRGLLGREVVSSGLRSSLG